MPRTSSFQLVDSAKDGKLATELNGLREQGKTFDEIARHFEGQGYSVSRETIRTWCAVAAGDAS